MSFYIPSTQKAQVPIAVISPIKITLACCLAENIRGVFSDYQRAYSNSRWEIVDIATRQIFALLHAAYEMRQNSPRETTAILAPVISEIETYLDKRMTIFDAAMESLAATVH